MPATPFSVTPIFDELQTEWERGWRPTYLTEPQSNEQDGTTEFDSCMQALVDADHEDALLEYDPTTSTPD